MKKSVRKLSLSRETLQTLDNIGLGRVAGAARTNNNCQTQTLPCDYTFTGCPDCPET